MRGYRKDKNPIVNAFKGVGKVIGEGMEAMAEAAREQEERAAAARELETKHREIVEHHIKEYEAATGLKWYSKNDLTQAIPTAGYNMSLPWDPEQRGHLLTCRDNCVTDHCLTCGMECYGQVYCSRHRP
jgi:hypothetical protein